MTSAVLIRYADEKHPSLARLVRTYDRKTIGPAVANSNGPKPTTANLIRAAFDQVPAIDKISLVVLNGRPFSVMHTAAGMFDCTGRRVMMQQVGGAA